MNPGSRRESVFRLAQHVEMHAVMHVSRVCLHEATVGATDRSDRLRRSIAPTVASCKPVRPVEVGCHRQRILAMPGVDEAKQGLF